VTAPRPTLVECLARYPDTDKNTVHSYGEVYEALFAPYRETANWVLEVGVRRGASLQAWRDYFTKAEIYGVDNGSELGHWRSDDPRITVRVGDPCHPETMDGAVGPWMLDIVIDDGCHEPEVQAATFVQVYPCVRRHGLYIIEDVQGIVAAERLQRFFGGRIVDLRGVKDRGDDLLLVWEK
jgi:hypothetical protein